MSPDRTLVQLAALAVGIVFLAVGILGFIPGITTNYGDMQFGGHESEAELFGIFQVSVLHNLIHLGFGVAGVVMAMGVVLSRIFLGAGAIAYAAFLVYGIAISHDTASNFIPVNDADNILHLGLAIGMLALAFLPAKVALGADRRRQTA